MEMEPADGEEIRRSICDMCCLGRCGIEVFVKNGRATRVQPFKDYPNGPLCVKGNSILSQLYHPDRLKYPMKRTSPKGSARAAWQRISWDEALGTIAENLAKIKQKYGPEKILFYAGDPKDPVRPNLQRLALKFGSPNYGTESSTCHRATVVATSLNGAGSEGLTPATKAACYGQRAGSQDHRCRSEDGADNQAGRHSPAAPSRHRRRAGIGHVPRDY
jgi:anaerobic selenocysteine-containing dehydrogenase